jgi:hypothetical protein
MLGDGIHRWSLFCLLSGLLAVTTHLPLLSVSAQTQSGSWEKLDVKTVEADLHRLWSGFCAALRAGDAEKAAEFFIPERRDNMVELYRLLGPSMKDMPEAWTEPTLIEVSNPFAQYAIKDESTGLLHTVLFLRYPDGKWLIQSF